MHHSNEEQPTRTHMINHFSNQAKSGITQNRARTLLIKEKSFNQDYFPTKICQVEGA
jgi:hypothetical protein